MVLYATMPNACMPCIVQLSPCRHISLCSSPPDKVDHDRFLKDGIDCEEVYHVQG